MGDDSRKFQQDLYHDILEEAAEWEAQKKVELDEIRYRLEKLVNPADDGSDLVREVPDPSQDVTIYVVQELRQKLAEKENRIEL